MEIENHHLAINSVGWFGHDSSMDDTVGGLRSDDKQDIDIILAYLPSETNHIPRKTWLTQKVISVNIIISRQVNSVFPLIHQEHLTISEIFLPKVHG